VKAQVYALQSGRPLDQIETIVSDALTREVLDSVSQKVNGFEVGSLAKMHRSKSYLD
jgi:hypothetical protein